MNFSSPQHQIHFRLRGRHVAAYAGFLLLGIMTIANSVGLAHLNQPSHSAAYETPTRILDAQVADLKQQVDLLNSQPPSVTQSDFDTAYKSMQEKLANLELLQTQFQSNTVHTADFQAIENRIATIEKNIAAVRHNSASINAKQRRAHVTKEAVEPEPPFKFFAIELRGNKRFVSIAPLDMSSPNQIRLLREGENEGEWRLEKLEDHAAVFRVNGRLQRLAIP